jgi:hypothetical protein
MRILVILRGISGRNPVGNWKYSAKYDAHLWRGEPMRPAEFNEFAESAEWRKIINTRGANVTVRIVNYNDMSKARAKLPATPSTGEDGE